MPTGTLGIDETGKTVTQGDSQGKVLSLVLGALQNSSGGGGVTVPAGDLGGTNSSPTVLQVHPAGATSEVSATFLKLPTDQSTDCAALVQAALDSGYSIFLDQAIWYVCSVAINLKKHGQYIRCVNELKGLKFTNDTNGAQGIAPYTPVGPHGGGADANSFRNITILGPGSYNSSTGVFSGSTGFGIRFCNTTDTWNGTAAPSTGAFSGDFFGGSRVHLQGWGIAGYVNGFGNMGCLDFDVSYNGRGLVFGDATGNGSRMDGISIGANATSGLEIYSGVGWSIFVKDCNIDDAASTVPVKLLGGSGTIIGANNEGIGQTGPVVKIGADLKWNVLGFHFTKAGGNDNPPVAVGVGNPRITFIGCTTGGFSTSPMVAIAADNGGVTGNFTGATYLVNGQTVVLSPLEVFTDSGLPTANAASRGRPFFVANTSNGKDDIMVIRQTGAGTYERLSLNPASLLSQANTFTVSQTMAGGTFLILTSAGGSIAGGNLNAGITLGTSLSKIIAEPINGHDWAFVYNANIARLWDDSGNNRMHLGWNTGGSTPSGTLNVNLYGKVGNMSELIIPSYTVALLPTGQLGDFALVTDATLTAITGLGLAPTGGSSNKVPVYHDGTGWKML